MNSNKNVQTIAKNRRYSAISCPHSEAELLTSLCREHGINRVQFMEKAVALFNEKPDLFSDKSKNKKDDLQKQVAELRNSFFQYFKTFEREQKHSTMEIKETLKTLGQKIEESSATTIEIEQFLRNNLAD